MSALPLAPACPLSLPCDMDSASTRGCSTTNVRTAEMMTDALARPDGSSRSCVRTFYRTLSQLGLFYLSMLSTPHRAMSTRRAPHRSPVYLLLSPQEACVRTSSTTRTARRTDRAIHECPRADRGQVPQPANPCVLASRSQEVRRFAGGARTRAPAGGECSTIHDTTPELSFFRALCTVPLP